MVGDYPVAGTNVVDLSIHLFNRSTNFMAKYTPRPVATVDLLKVRAAYATCLESDQYLSRVKCGCGHVFENYSAGPFEKAGLHDGTKMSLANLTG